MIMANKRKRYYVTLEIEADVSSDTSKDEQRQDLFDFIDRGMRQKGLNYSFYVQHSHILSYINEKGEVL